MEREIDGSPGRRQVTPADVRCPEGIEVQAGGTFTCTAMVDGEPVTYWVHQNDDQGNLTITYDRLLRLDAVEAEPRRHGLSGRGVAVTVDCGPTGRTVLVRNSPRRAHLTAPPPTRPTRPTAHS